MACAAQQMQVVPRAGAALCLRSDVALRCSVAFARANARCSIRTRRGARNAALPRASGEAESRERTAAVTRRDCLSALAAAPLLTVHASLADDDVELRTFYGAAQPPATYGGVGGCKREQARYSLVLPTSFTEVAVSKVEKGSTGVDCHFTGPRKAEARVITLRNEGSRDGAGFSLKDPASALASVSGSDFKLQDALAAGTMTTGKRSNGFTYDVAGPTSLAIGLTTSPDGRLFAIIVSAPSSAWAANAELYNSVRDSFTVFDLAA